MNYYWSDSSFLIAAQKKNETIPYILDYRRTILILLFGRSAHIMNLGGQFQWNQSSTRIFQKRYLY